MWRLSEDVQSCIEKSMSCNITWLFIIPVIYQSKQLIALFLLVSARALKGWQFRFNLQNSFSAYLDGPATLTGHFGITVSGVPEAPDFTANLAKFSNASSLDVYYVTDQVREISPDGILLTPVW